MHFNISLATKHTDVHIGPVSTVYVLSFLMYMKQRKAFRRDDDHFYNMHMQLERKNMLYLCLCCNVGWIPSAILVVYEMHYVLKRMGGTWDEVTGILMRGGGMFEEKTRSRILYCYSRMSRQDINVDDVTELEKGRSQPPPSQQAPVC